MPPAKLAAADVAITVPLDGYTPLGFRRKARDLIRAGPCRGRGREGRLLPLAVDRGAVGRWREARAIGR